MPRRFRLRDLLIALAVVGLLSAWGVQILAARRWESRQVACASNLRSLWQSQFNYAALHGRMPAETGPDFFLALQRGNRPIINRYEPFFCPLSGDPVGPGRTSYRGPAVPINLEDVKVRATSADKEGNHGPGRGGNVLTILGDVIEVPPTDPLWIQARTTTR